MEARAQVRRLAGWARERALGDGVSGCRVATAKVPGAYTGMTAHSGRVPPLRMPAKMMRGHARRAILIASRQNIKNRANSLTTNEKTFSNRYFFGRFGSCTTPHQS